MCINAELLIATFQVLFSRAFSFSLHVHFTPSVHYSTQWRQVRSGLVYITPAQLKHQTTTTTTSQRSASRHITLYHVTHWSDLISSALAYHLHSQVHSTFHVRTRLFTRLLLCLWHNTIICLFSCHHFTLDIQFHFRLELVKLVQYALCLFSSCSTLRSFGFGSILFIFLNLCKFNSNCDPRSSVL